ncbi:MAG TPA: TlpA disulfide reductase family protein [Pirellulales bacterium]|nr:TlpA disulfide reductase family protein [Pirellulales bacterium]
MSRNRTRWLIACFIPTGILLAGWTGLTAADEKSDLKTPAARDSNAKGARETATAKDPFAVPDGTPADLLKYIQKGEKFQPQVNSQDELNEFLTKSRKAIIAAADKILAAKTTDSIRLAAIKSKRNALGVLIKVGSPDIPKLLKDFLDQIKDDKQAEVARLAKGLGLKIRIAETGPDPIAGVKLWNDIKSELNAVPTDSEMVMLAVEFASGLERGNPGCAPQVLPDISAILSKNKDAKIAELGKTFEGVARRLSLTGKPIEIAGTLLDGTKFDPASVQGKVVLVDFWATWCPPCREELPNVKQNYEKYHEKGFEVVGVSLDQSRDDLQKFIADEKIAWPILFPKDSKDQYWKHPLAVYYGVNAIPCAILTNQKGEVVSLSARGAELTDKLAELLGTAEKKEAKIDDSKTPK